MPLELRKGRGGRLRRTWYGRYEAHGKRFTVNLGIKVAGKPPASLLDEGDVAFERSRALAEAKLKQITEEAQNRQGTAHLIERLYELKTGETLKAIPLADLAEQWKGISRRRVPEARYAEQCCKTLTRFVEFLGERFPQVQELSHVTRQAAREFLDAESGRGVTGKTWNDKLKLLRATFKHLLPQGCTNPFSSMVTRDTDTVFRQPFTPEELRAVLEAAQGDGFIRPIIVTGICTAMRRGDCCLLKWKDVDLVQGFITVKTGKTGVTVSIPIFPMLFDELTALKTAQGKAASGNAHVFPEQAKMYEENPDGITTRVRKVLAAAGFADAGGKGRATRPLTEEEKARVMASLATLPPDKMLPERRERLKRMFTAYASGARTGTLAAQECISTGSVSNALNEIERISGVSFIRRKTPPAQLAVPLRGQIHAERTSGGLRRASLRDFHSFRVTWVTLALTSGVPMELVTKVTGHKTVEIVLRHYFQPGREQFRQALQKSMPKLLTDGGAKSPMDQVADIVAAATDATAWRDIQAIRAVLKGNS